MCDIQYDHREIFPMALFLMGGWGGGGAGEVCHHFFSKT